MKYLILNGSPHKGNTWKLAELIRDNIKELSPDAVFEEIQLSDIKLPFCTGCSLCFRKGQQYCPHNHIMQEIINKIDESDGLILAVTTFNMQPTATLKNLIDHMCFMLHRPHFFRNKAIVISTVGAVGGKSAVKYVAGWLAGIGFNRCYKLLVSSYSWNNYMPNEMIKMKCKKLAKKFHEDVSSKKMHAPSFGILIPYNLFRGMSPNYVKGTEYETEDGVYWTQPVRAKRTYDLSIPVPFYKRLFGNLFYFIGKAGGKFVTVTYKKTEQN